MIPDHRIRQLISAVEAMQEAHKEAGEDLASAVAAAKAEGLEPKALKLCLSLKKAEPHKVRPFLATFDACRSALDLDAQMDIEDAIEAAEANGEEPPAEEDGGEDGPEPSPYAGRAVPKGRGRRRSADFLQ